MHKTTAAAGARRVRAKQQPKARAFSTPTQCRLALAAVVLHDVGSWLARAAEGRARPAALATHGQRPAGWTSLPVSPKRGASEGPQVPFQKLALQGRYIQRTIRTALKAAITIYVLQGGYKEDFDGLGSHQAETELRQETRLGDS